MKMERWKQTTKGELMLVEPMVCRDGNGGFSYVKRLFKEGGILVMEKDGKCYAEMPFRECPIFVAIKEKFDELEGEEVKAGGNASETEE